jgi:hypothetical protein
VCVGNPPAASGSSRMPAESITRRMVPLQPTTMPTLAASMHGRSDGESPTYTLGPPPAEASLRKMASSTATLSEPHCTRLPGRTAAWKQTRRAKRTRTHARSIKGSACRRCGAGMHVDAECTALANGPGPVSQLVFLDVSAKRQ